MFIALIWLRGQSGELRIDKHHVYDHTNNARQNRSLEQNVVSEDCFTLAIGVSIFGIIHEE